MCNDHLLSAQECLTIAHLKLDDTCHLPNRVDLAIGMKAMIILNISTEVNLANGSHGIISDIILDPRENLTDTSSPTIYLKFPPAVILFCLFNCNDLQLPSLERGTVPIFPTHKTFSIQGEKKVTIDRWQFVMTPAYAFMDYKAQGQTMECVIADIAKPPTGSLSPFNEYVTLSCSCGQHTIRLLQDFEERLFTTHPSEELQKEDARLAILEKKTMEQYAAGEFRNFPSLNAIQVSQTCKCFFCYQLANKINPVIDLQTSSVLLPNYPISIASFPFLHVLSL
jgi:hypothetical protein